MSATAFWLYLGSAIGLGLFAIALLAWAMLSDRSRGRRRCPKCWYAIHADCVDKPIRCSECGWQIQHEKNLHRTRRRWKPAYAGAVLLVFASFLALQPKVKPYGWGSMTPMTALLLLLQFDDLDWVNQGIGYQISHDLFNRMRAPDFLEHADPAKQRAMWRWQWRWLGRTILSRLDDEDLNLQLRRTYLDWLALCRAFADDPELSAAISPVLNAELEKNNPWSHHRAPQLSVDYADIDGSIARLMPLFESESDDAVWGAMLGLRAIALRDQRGVDLLLSLLEHDTARVRSGAVSSLGFVVRRNGYDATLHEVVDAMGNDEDCNVRSARIVSLANMLNNDEKWPMIEDAMKSDDDCVRKGGFSAAFRHCREWQGESPATPESVVVMAIESIDIGNQPSNWYAAWILEEVARDRHQRSMLLPHVEAIEAFAEHDDPTISSAIAVTLHHLDRR